MPLVLQCLTAGEAGGPANQDNIIIWDTGAKLLLEMAEQPDTAKSSTLSEELNLPDKPDTYNLAVTPGRPFGNVGSSDLIWSKNQTGTVFSQILSALESYVAPVVDVLTIFQSELIPVAAALSAVEAGENFASGDDAAGVFAALGAIGSALNFYGAYGSLTQLFGNSLSEATVTAEDLDGVVVASKEGNMLNLIESSLGAATNLSSDQNVQQFAAVGSALASTASAVQSGDVMAALQNVFITAFDGNLIPGETYIPPQSLQQDVTALLETYISTEYSGASGNDVGGQNTGPIEAALQWVDDTACSIDVSSLQLLSDAQGFFLSQEDNIRTSDVPSLNSGVTIGMGVDLSRQNAIGLALNGVPQSLIVLLGPYLGVGNASGVTVTLGATGTAAQNLTPLSLSPSQVLTLNDAVMSANLTGTGGTKGIIPEWNAASPVQTWSQLPEDTQIALFWLSYNGAISPTASPHFWSDAKSGNWGEAVHELLNWTGSPDATNSNLIPSAQLIIKDLMASGSPLTSA